MSEGEADDFGGDVAGCAGDDELHCAMGDRTRSWMSSGRNGFSWPLVLARLFAVSMVLLSFTAMAWHGTV